MDAAEIDDITARIDGKPVRQPKRKPSVELIEGDCRDVLKEFDDNSIDAVVTDPPYGLSFMGKHWDYDVPDVGIWREVLRALKPGGHLLSFGGSRTYHRMAVAIEDAGFEIRDQIMWLYGSGFPKSSNQDGDWEGWGTALKPAHEPIVMARKPLIGTVAANLLAYGVGARNIDATRVTTSQDDVRNNREDSTVCTCSSRGASPSGRTEGKYNPASPSSPHAPAADPRPSATRYGRALKEAPNSLGGYLNDRRSYGEPARRSQEDDQGGLPSASDEGRFPDRCAKCGRIRADLSMPYDTIPNVETIGNGRGGEASADRRYGDKGATNFAAAPGPRGGDPKGRWPANIIHDGSDEVLAAFPSAPGQQGYVGPEHGDKLSINTYGDFGARPPTPPRGDSGSAARFFYCAKASRADRNDGLDSEAIVSIFGAWESADQKVTLRVAMDTSPPRVIGVSGPSKNSVSEWNTLLFGSGRTGQSQTDSRSTTETKINSTIASKICASFLTFDTSESTQAATLTQTELSGSLAGSAESIDLSLTTTSEKMASALGVSPAQSPMRLRINVFVALAKSSHPTVKPTDLMRYLCRLVTPPGGTVLDPFMGSGSTGRGAVLEGFDFIGIEMDAAYYDIADQRIAAAERECMK